MKKILIPLLSLAIIAVAGSVIYTLAPVGGDGGGWRLFSEDVYIRFPMASDDPVLVKRLQDAAGEEPDVRTFGGSGITGEFRLDIADGGETWACDMSVVSSGGTVIAVPQNPDDLSFEYVATSEGRAFAATDRGIWEVTPAGETIRVSSDRFDDVSIDELIERSARIHGANMVLWDTNVLPSPDGEHLVYSSNKNDMENLSSSLFVLDPDSCVESLLAQSPRTGFSPVAWLDNERVVCTEAREDESRAAIVDLAGTLTRLRLEGAAPEIYAVQDGLIAYVTDIADTSEIAVADCRDGSEPKIILRSQMGYQTRNRASFSPGGTKFACVFYPEADFAERHVRIVDIRTREETTIAAFPPQVNETAYIHEFSWIDDESLLVHIGETADGSVKDSTWVYTLE
jgi:hypothetical protein